jgi:hypothetical protein
MLFIATFMLKNKSSGEVVINKYLVDLLRGHVVKGINIYNTCMSTLPIHSTQLMNTALIPKALRPIIIGRLLRTSITVTGNAARFPLVAFDGKHWSGSIDLERKVVPRPVQTLPVTVYSLW